MYFKKIKIPDYRDLLANTSCQKIRRRSLILLQNYGFSFILFSMRPVKSNTGSAMKFFLPYTKHFGCLKDRVVFYGNGKGYPEVSGGRAPENAHLVEKAELHRLVETLGPRFQWAANSTRPDYTRSVKEMLHRIAANSSSVIVTDFNFAVRIKQDFPDIPLVASCIMSLTMTLQKIQDSGLFHRVVTPQFWNYDFDKLGKLQGKENLVTIVNSKCDHSEDPQRCLRHYNYNSKMYAPPPYEELEKDWSEKCEFCRYMAMSGKLLSQLGEDTLGHRLEMYWKYKPEKFPPWSVVIQELNRRGFVQFKFQGRSFASLKKWAKPIINFIEAL